MSSLVHARPLSWRWQYVPDGQMTPDERGRWLVIGSIEVPIELVPHYRPFGRPTMPIDLVHIQYTQQLQIGGNPYPPQIAPEHTFTVRMSFLHEANNGLNSQFMASTLKEAQLQAQQKLQHLAESISILK
jgi:hypothetical protein